MTGTGNSLTNITSNSPNTQKACCIQNHLTVRTQLSTSLRKLWGKLLSLTTLKSHGTITNLNGSAIPPPQSVTLWARVMILLSPQICSVCQLNMHQFILIVRSNFKGDTVHIKNSVIPHSRRSMESECVTEVRSNGTTN